MLQEWAKQEIDFACKREQELSKNELDALYGIRCYKSAYKAFLSLLEDEHSGYSIGITKGILNRLIDGIPLIPIEDSSDIWGNEQLINTDDTQYKSYQCKRMSSLFKHIYPDGTVKYTDINRYYCVDINDGTTYTNSLVNKVLDEIYPITMPYMPSSEKFKVYCHEFLLKSENGDFDHMMIDYIIEPNGYKVDAKRCFAEYDGDMKEITYGQYYLDYLKSTLNKSEARNLESLTPELVTGTIGQILDECVIDEKARKLLDGLYQSASKEVEE